MLAHLQGQLFNASQLGASWEGFVLEQIAAHAPAGAEFGFYRTAAGTEIDAVLGVGQHKLGFEIKFSSAPKVGRGFWQAIDDLQLDRAFVVAPVARRYPLAANVDVIPVDEIAQACRGVAISGP